VTDVVAIVRFEEFVALLHLCELVRAHRSNSATKIVDSYQRQSGFGLTAMNRRHACSILPSFVSTERHERKGCTV
jgi:hypothetical protein